MKLDFYRFGKNSLFLIPTIAISWGYKSIDITWLQWVLELDFSTPTEEDGDNETLVFDLLEKEEKEAKKEFEKAFTEVYLLGLQKEKESYAKEQVIKELEKVFQEVHLEDNPYIIRGVILEAIQKQKKNFRS